MNPQKTVVVCGAGSQLGVFLLPRLHSGGYRVTAISRQAPAKPLSVTDRVCWARPGDVPESATFLLSCGPIELAAEQVERLSGLEKAVVFSTSSIRTKQASGNRVERQKVAAIASGEDRLVSLCRKRGVSLVLLRPTLVYGCGMDRNVSLLLRLGERTGLIPLTRRSGGLRQPVHADDLAALAVSALGTETGSLLEGEACGGETLTFREMTERTAACGRRRIRLLVLPGPLLGTLVKIASVMGPWKGINTEMVRRQSRDMTFDDRVFRDALAWRPRPFQPTPEDFKIPPEIRRFRLST